MALPDAEWLPIAQRLPVGTTRRVLHRRESRPNLIIGHEHGHYWAYCQACKEGGKQAKTHVLVTGAKAPVNSTSLSLPTDMVRLDRCDLFTQESIAAFLARKGMDLLFMPPVHYSADRKRLLIQTKQGWIGRDLTGNSPQKWLTYSYGCVYLADAIKQHVIFTEDAFSWIKVSYTVATSPHWSCVCLLGTELRPKLLNEMLRRGVTSTHFFLDGDAAGAAGAKRGVRLLRPYFKSSRIGCAPQGMDPKDMPLARIREWCGLHSPTKSDLEI